MIGIKVQAQVISAESKPYNMNGNEGVSHRIRFLKEGSIFSAKSTAEQVKLAKEYVGQNCELGLIFGSPKEILNLTIDSIE